MSKRQLNIRKEFLIAAKQGGLLFLPTVKIKMRLQNKLGRTK